MTNNTNNNESKAVVRIYMALVFKNGDVHIKQHTKENKARMREIYSANDGAKIYMLRGVDTEEAFNNLIEMGYKADELRLIKTRVHAPKASAIELGADFFDDFDETEEDETKE